MNACDIFTGIHDHAPKERTPACSTLTKPIYTPDSLYKSKSHIRILKQIYITHEPNTNNSTHKEPSMGAGGTLGGLNADVPKAYEKSGTYGKLRTCEESTKETKPYGKS